jgi:hypothetical protein
MQGVPLTHTPLTHRHPSQHILHLDLNDSFKACRKPQKMLNWHERTCKNPEITFYPSLGVPCCHSCGVFASIESEVDESHDELTIPKALKRSEMQLSWPPSVSYAENVYLDDPEGMTEKALLSELNQKSQDETESTNQSLSFLPSSASAVHASESLQLKSTYEPLQESRIRVLCPLPGQFGDYLHGHFEIIHVQDDSGPGQRLAGGFSVVEGQESTRTYEAVSYTWANRQGDRRRKKSFL